MSDSDFHLDAQLRDVPLPEGFAERLQAALLPSDASLDAAIAAVAVPSTVLARLKEIPGDLVVDEALADFVSPPALIHSLRRPTWRDQLWRVARRLQHLAVAAVWFIALSAALAASLRAIISGTLARDADDSEIVFIYDGPLSLASVQPQRDSAEFRLAAAMTPSELLPDVEPSDDRTPPIARVDVPDVAGPPPAGPVGQWVSLVSSGLRPLDDAMLLRYGVLASPHYSDDRLPELTSPHQPRAAGIEPPPVRGYDRAFFLKHRLFPPISPAAHPALTEVGVPLTVSGDVLSRIQRSLAEDRVPQDIRVEDLIAAQDYRFDAPPAGRLGLQLTAGPAVFGPPESGLLLIGVQAGALARPPKAATHLVIAIDLSHSMSRGGRLEIVQESLRRLLEQLSPQDRLSLVIFNEEVTHVVEAASLSDTESLRQFVSELAPHGGTNLAASLQQAASLAMSDVAGDRAERRLVLVTDSQATMPAVTRDRVEQVLQAAGATGVRLDVLDLSQRGQTDLTLETWAADLRGGVRQVADSRQMARLLLEALSGREASIAQDARLTLRFNPETVAAYRLIGHEANALADLSPPALEAEFSAGESSAALVEIWPLPGSNRQLGQVELTWRDPRGGKLQRLRQPITRQQFVAAPGEVSQVSLIQAALAAEVGESLRESYPVLRQAGLRPGNLRGLTAILDAAERAPSPLLQRPDVGRLLQIVKDLKRLGVR